MLTRTIGSALGVVGLALAFGNITGMFSTFPFAGFLTITAGAVLYKWGRWETHPEDRKPKGEPRSRVIICPNCGEMRQLTAGLVGKEIYCLRCHHGPLDTTGEDTADKPIPPPGQLRIRYIKATPWRCSNCRVVWALPLNLDLTRLVPCPECKHIPKGDYEDDPEELIKEMGATLWTTGSPLAHWQPCPKCNTRIYVGTAPFMGNAMSNENAVKCSECNHVWAWPPG